MHSRSRNFVTYALVLAIVLSLLSTEPVAIMKPLVASCEFAVGTRDNSGVFHEISSYTITLGTKAISVGGVDKCGWPTIYFTATACNAMPHTQDWTVEMDGGGGFVTKTDADGNFGLVFLSPYLGEGVNMAGQPALDWCVSVKELSSSVHELNIPLTIVNPSTTLTSSFSWSFTSLMWSTTTTTGAWISIPSEIHIFTSTASSSQSSTGAPTTSSFTYVFQTLSMPGPAEASTDWAVLSVSLTPSTPQEGDQVMFGMQMAALSSSVSFPQSVDVECMVDGMSCGGGSVSYPGPAGIPATVTASTPWTATPGTHTLTWSVSTANDPNPNDNAVSTTFTVGSPAQTTLASTPTTPVVTEATVSPQTPTPTLSTNTTMIPSLGVVITVNQATPASPSTQASPPPIGTLSQTDLLLIGAVVVLVALLAVVTYRRRKASGPATGQGSATDAVFCSHCGTQNPTTHQFCEKCGAKL